MVQGCLVTKTQTYDIDYSNAFTLVEKMNIVKTLLVLAILKNWLLHQLDVKNTFLHIDYSCLA